MTDQEIINAFHLMWGDFPEPVTITQKSREIIAVNKKAEAMGLKPAVWVGGFCPVKTKIYKERPEWFIDYKYRIDWTQPLDISKKDRFLRSPISPRRRQDRNGNC